MAEQFEELKVDKEFKVCPNCGYKDGFHSMFQRIGDSNDFCLRFDDPSPALVFLNRCLLCRS